MIRHYKNLRYINLSNRLPLQYHVSSCLIQKLALVAFAASASFAGENCTKAEKTSADSKTCSATTNATKASADSKTCSASTKAINASGEKAACSATCTDASKTNAMKASANGVCTKADMAACAEKMGVSVEECMKMCGENGTMTMHKISIEGMTCGSCENSVKTAIEAVPGVQKVVSISYKDANAVVCVDKNSTCTETLTKAISDKGYKAQLIPAVATNATAVDAKGSCSKTCTAAEKAACAAKEKDSSKKPEDTK